MKRFVRTRFALILADSVILAAFVALMSIAAGARLDAASVIKLVIGATIIVAAGFVIVSTTTGESVPARNALAILLGAIATSLFLLGGCFLTKARADWVFLAWSGLVMPAALRRFRSNPSFPRPDNWEVFTLVAIAIVTALWCYPAARMLPTLQATGISTMWSDYSIHGTEIAQFGDPHVRELSSFLLSGVPLILYHYAPYMIPAAAASIIDLPPWGLATCLLLPFGILLAALGAQAVVRTLSTPALALVAPIALLLVPDASTFGFKNGFFGFHWLLYTAPGSGYGIAVSFTAIALVAIWFASGTARCMWLAVLVTFATFEFRAQLFLLFVPTLALALFCESPLVRRHHRASLLAAVLATAAAVCVIALPPVQHAWLRFSAFQQFLTIVHTGMEPTAYDGVYQALQLQVGTRVAAAVGFLALIPMVLGVLTFALPVTLWIAVRRSGWRTLDLLPICCLAAWLALVLLVPSAKHGGVTEFQHRPFVLVYATGFLWTLIFLERALGAHTTRTYGRFTIPSLIAALVAVGTASGTVQAPGRPRFSWADRHFNTRVEPGVMHAAAFLRAEATIGDTFAVVPPEPFVMNDDAATRLAALAGVPVFLARPGIQRLNGETRREIVDERLALLSQVGQAADADAALLALRRAGVDFLVTLGDHCPSFDADCARAAFHSADAVAYRITPR